MWNGCNATWLYYPQTAVLGALVYLQYRAVDDCLAGCAYMLPGCVAALYRNSTKSPWCFLLTDVNRVSNRMSAQGAPLSLYVLVPVCTDVTPPGT